MPASNSCLCFSGILLVQRDIRLLALCSQGQTALLQLRLWIIPVLVQNELLQHTNRNKNTHVIKLRLSQTSFKRIKHIRNKNQLQFQTLSLFRSCFYLILAMTLSTIFPPSFSTHLFALSLTGSPSVSSRWVQITGYLRQKPIPGQI